MKNDIALLPATGFIRKPTVMALVPYGNTKLYAEIKAGRFPRPVKLGPRTSAWRCEEIKAWIDEQGRAPTLGSGQAQ